MSVILQPKTIYKGEDKSYIIKVVDADGDRVDITGFGVEFEVKTAAGATGQPAIAKSVGSGITIAPDQVANKGEATLVLVPADTSALAPRLYVYDLVAIDVSGLRRVVIPPSDFDLREVVNVAE